jgi:hypothetical protein
VVTAGEASATCDRSPAVLVGRRTTSESVESSTSGCSSSDIASDDIDSHSSLVELPVVSPGSKFNVCDRSKRSHEVRDVPRSRYGDVWMMSR